MAKKISKKNTALKSQQSAGKSSNEDNISVKPARLNTNPLFPIVGIGASAGGLEAFTQLISALPADTGLAFVLVQHLLPTQPSSLSNILSRSTIMPIAEVQNNTDIQPNHIYVIPPGMDMIISGSLLKLKPRKEISGQHLPIDHFFHSLAEECGDRAIGVVLSGAANDGTLGLAAIKSAGGITFAQDDTAWSYSMPHSAINSGYVDFVMPPAKIADEIAHISQHPYAKPEPQEQAQNINIDITPVVQLLHNIIGVDFTNYKPSTLYRRITRRMLLNKIDRINDYINLLQENRQEAEALYQDILISVTNFFRNPEVFEALKTNIFPQLIKNHAPGEPLRIWTLGCSTGEEAYSLAIAFTEFSKNVDSNIQLQLFATDLNNNCIEKARLGIYQKTITKDVSPERIRRFFTEVEGGYRINKSIRDLCIFSRHNILADPSFSRMDLISCRNLLIYLEPVLQQQIMLVLHYALAPAGMLVLGGSETIGSCHNLFDVADIRNKFYYKKSDAITAAQTILRINKIKRSDAIFSPARPSEVGTDLQKQADRVLLKKYAPPSVLVAPNMEILQFRGDTGPYLAPSPGKASLNLMKMLREGLFVTLRAAIDKVSKDMVSVKEKGLRVKTESGYREVTIEVIPINNNITNENAFLIIFDDALQPQTFASDKELKNTNDNISSPKPDPSIENKQVAGLVQELSDTREYLQSVIDQHEIANEELQTSHEEVQSTNEELQSINEELETSKEEIQASNEELATVNDEMVIRNDEMSRINNDMVNLLGSVQLSIIMLDAQLRIRRFTPWAEKMLNLINSDIGRPFCGIKLNFTLTDIESLLHDVLRNDVIKEIEIQSTKGNWYSLRVRPYKTIDNVIDGVVIMLVDVDKLKRAYEYSESIVSTVREPLLVLDENMRVKTASRSFLINFGLAPENVINNVLFDIDNGQWDIPELRKILKEILPRDNFFNDFEVEHEFVNLGRRNLMFTARKLIQHDNSSPAILVAIEDITDHKQLEKMLRQRAEELVEADRHKNEFLATLAHELRNPLAPLGNALEVMRLPNATHDMVIQSREMIERQLSQMVRLVDDLLDISRITSGKIALRMESLNITDIIKAAIDTVQPLITERKLKLTVDICAEPLWVNADMTRISQVFANLLNNSAKYTNAGGHIEIIAKKHENQAVIQVQDNGIGIAADMLPKIFDIFIQGDNSFTSNSGGLGLGLHIVKSLVTMHNGSVEAYSKGLVKGSIFTVKLPLINTPKQDSYAHESTAATPDKNIAHCRVLVVDDNIPSAQTMGWIVELMGYQVKSANDGATAISLAKSFLPNAILLDIGLPDISGYEVCKQLRAEPSLKDTVIIAQTGWGQKEHKKLSKEAGFDYHFVKPVNIQELTDVLQSVDKKISKK